MILLIESSCDEDSGVAVGLITMTDDFRNYVC